MSLTSTLLDQTAESRDHVIQNVFKYLGTDTCCFLADAELRALVKRQKKAFTPVREWLENEWNCPLAMTDSVFMLKHPQETVARVKTMLQSLDSAALTALQVPHPPPPYHILLFKIQDEMVISCFDINVPLFCPYRHSLT
jgi:chaperone required for assembly of F1-ATPase